MLSYPGFLGTRADLITDVVVVGFVAIPPLLWWSAMRARRGDHRLHRAVQTATLAVLSVLLVLFELNIRLRGESVFLSGGAGAGLRASLYVHLAIAVSTFLVWVALVLISWPRLGKVLPGRFSPGHRRLGRAVIAGTVLTALTGAALYVAAFVR
jgi:uncharacterized membrane protein YozB (DUF420 family)